VCATFQTRFMVPMVAEKRKGAFHDPYVFRVRAPFESGGGPPHSTTLARWPRSPELPPVFGVRRPCGALDFPGRFKVPMHAKKRMKALHEPSSRPRFEGLSSRTRTSRRTIWFMVPCMRKKAERGLSMNRATYLPANDLILFHLCDSGNSAARDTRRSHSKWSTALGAGLS